MKICYLCPDSGIVLSKYNGSAAHVRAIVGAFVELGHQVDVVMSGVEGTEELGVGVDPIPRVRFAHELSRFVGKDDASPHRAQSVAVLRALRRIWANGAVERVLEQRLQESRSDLVYERYSPFGVAGAMVARRLGVPHVLEVNAPLAWEGATHRGQALNEGADVLERLAFAATTRIVAVSDELRGQLVESGVDPGKIHVVPNGVDPRRFGRDGRRRPEGLKGVVAGFVGSLKAWHGIDVLAEAFAAAGATNPDLHLLVVGDGPLADRARDLESHLPGRVTLTGAVHPREVPDYLRAMDIAVAPYPALDRFYFSPLKVLEYMASGAAVIASRIGQIEQWIDHERTGLLVQPGSADELARALERLAADAALRERLGAHARAAVRSHHTWLHRAEDILQFARTAA